MVYNIAPIPVYIYIIHVGCHCIKQFLFFHYYNIHEEK